MRAEEGGSGFKLTGGHDVDQGWIAKLREPVSSSSTEGQCSSDDAGSETCSTDAATSKVRTYLCSMLGGQSSAWQGGWCDEDQQHQPAACDRQPWLANVVARAKAQLRACKAVKQQCLRQTPRCLLLLLLYWLLLQGPPLIVPRVIFELSPQDLVKALQNQQAVIAMIVEEIQKQGLDGLVSSMTNQSMWLGAMVWV